MMSRLKIGIILILFLCAVTIPTAAAALKAGEAAVFSGFLLNPWDGNSYLAKMYQGWQGNWTYRLPYSPNPGEGTYLYLFYLFLGHLSRWLNVDQLLVYHSFRVLGGVFLFFSLYSFLQKFFPAEEKETTIIKALLLCVFGSGLGWLFFLFVGMTADFWVAETYPFLSTLTNPHFPMTLALVLHGLMLFRQPVSVWVGTKLVLTGLVLAILSPFGVALVMLVMLVQALWMFFEDKIKVWQPLVWFGAGGAPYLVYLLWVYWNHPQIAAWQQQNITLTPGIPDLLISLSPAFLLACVGVHGLWLNKTHPGRKLWLSWFLAGGLMVFIPFSLQRRLLLGYYVPCAALAMIGLAAWFKNRLKYLNHAYVGVFTLSLPTILILFATISFGIETRDSMLYLSSSESKAMDWIEQNTPKSSVIISSSEMGMFIPAHTGRYVLYGHPFETPQAEEMRILVETFFKNDSNREGVDEVLKTNQVTYIFYGSREKALGDSTILSGYPIVFQDGEVTIFFTGNAD